MPLAFLALALVAPEFAELRVLDAATGRGVPLVEMETTHGVRFVTDNAGRVAIIDPDLIGREVYFRLTTHGYEVPKDGFGIAGVRVKPRVGSPVIIRLKRTAIAERLGRLTGEGRFRDSELLGHPVPTTGNGRVAGQDSIQDAVYRGKLFWLWGDTSRLEYPLGLFRMAGATTPLPPPDPTDGLMYDYFTDPKTGFARAMMPLPERPEGVIWIGGLCVVPDATGIEKLVGHYSRRKGLADEFEQGVCVFDDASATFQVAKQRPLTETWRRPAGHPITFDEDGQKWLLFGSPTPTVRVPATYEAVLDPTRYEAFTLTSGGYRWQKEGPPADSKQEQEWLKGGTLKRDDARFLPIGDGKPVMLHSGSVRWNEFRKRWVLVTCQIGGTSFLGEVWYAEASHPTGPFRRAVKVATHDNQSLYNVCHHATLDRSGGRVIHFEGTYTRDFSGSPLRTPRYDYNQLLYRLDLADHRLTAAHEHGKISPNP